MPRARATAISLLLSVVGAGPPGAVTYQPPVPAPVVDGFGAPASPYGPGNRGLEYATRPGQPVRAAAPGVVTFAATVAGERYVTVLHDDRVRTSYGRLRSVAVVAGQPVDAGDLLGEAGPRLIWTARLGGDAYLDPAVLLAASGRAPVRLVPVRRPDGGGPAGARPAPVARAAAEWALGGSG